MKPTSTRSEDRWTRGGGPDGGLEAFQIGFASAPAVNLRHPGKAELYWECDGYIRIEKDDEFHVFRIAEAHGLEDSNAIFDAAIAELVMDALAVDPDLRLACSVSWGTLANSSNWQRFINLLNERSCLARRMTLEVSESCVATGFNEIFHRLQHAKQAGCRLALDHYEAGLVSRVPLRFLDVEWDVVKIDRSCFGDLRKTPAGREGLKALVGLAHCIAPIVVLEGVETSEHLALASASGAHYGQGRMFENLPSGHWSALSGEVEEDLRRAFTVRARRADVSPDATLPRDLTDSGRVHPVFTIDRLGDRIRSLLRRSRHGRPH